MVLVKIPPVLVTLIRITKLLDKKHQVLVFNTLWTQLQIMYLDQAIMKQQLNRKTIKELSGQEKDTFPVKIGI